MRTGNTIVIPADGEYEVIYSCYTVSNDAVLAIYRNGVVLAEGRSDQVANRSDSVQGLAMFSAGDVIEVGITSTTSVTFQRANVTVKQLASRTVNLVPSGLIEATTLHVASVSSLDNVTTTDRVATTIGGGYDVLDLDHAQIDRTFDENSFD